jgi:hypothetical protein
MQKAILIVVQLALLTTYYLLPTTYFLLLTTHPKLHTTSLLCVSWHYFDKKAAIRFFSCTFAAYYLYPTRGFRLGESKAMTECNLKI